MSGTTQELLAGFAAGIAEGVIETVYPPAEVITTKLNSSAKSVAPAGYMMCGGGKVIGKALMTALFFII